MFTWGKDKYGQLGHKAPVSTGQPDSEPAANIRAVSDLSHITQVWAYPSSCCVWLSTLLICCVGVPSASESLHVKFTHPCCNVGGSCV
ncbi:RCC1-like domain-containing protein, partial [Enterococcus faecium]|uniref:RCC1-like domain-containing protein n=1 Tax=Enterococcus faecium TaxID=1352 RepID=UPI003F51C5D8